MQALEDIDYQNSRSLDKGLVQSLDGYQWVKEHRNVLITGPTGVGKTWLACALAHKVCWQGYYTAHYVRHPTIARADYCQGRRPILKTPDETGQGRRADGLILDDWRLMKLSAENRRDLLEDRHNRRSTIATSQLPIEKWHGVIVDAILADSILDRLVHNAHKINFRGGFMRKRQAKLTDTMASEKEEKARVAPVRVTGFT